MEIVGLIQEGKKLLVYEDYRAARDAWNIWFEKIERFIAQGKLSPEQSQSLKVKMHFTENEYSQFESKKAFRDSVNATISFLKIINEESEDVMQEKLEMQIIERVLENFYLYLRAMYQAPVHRKGTIKQDDLQRIAIGNEYDLQRMLYSLLLPIFPELRMEVNGDNGYSGMRADLYLDKYDLIIEIKCSRGSMTEKKLTEELGADAFHYHAKNLFIFVYDKECMIKNVEAYKLAFKRDCEKDGKRIRMFIAQPVQL